MCEYSEECYCVTEPSIIKQAGTSERDPAGFRYAWIHSVADDQGIRTERTLRGRSMGATVNTGRTVHPGDRVVFRCQGGDPHGRELRWWLHPFGTDPQPQVRGDRVELTWIVQPHSVGHRVYVGVGMAADSRYHRQGGPHEQGYDGWIVFYYRVVPATTRGHADHSPWAGAFPAIPARGQDAARPRIIRAIGRCHDQP